MKGILSRWPIAALTGLFALGLMASTAEAGNLTAWDKVKKNKDRFTVLGAFNKEAVRDNETQLVWEKSPGETDGVDGINIDDRMNWASGDNGSGAGGGAHKYCLVKTVGGRQGWKLPTVEQLSSLLHTTSVCLADPSQACLPNKHPFKDIQPFWYWTSTENAEDDSNAWRVNFLDPVTGADFNVASVDKDANPAHVWCVRSGQSGPSAY